MYKVELIIWRDTKSKNSFESISIVSIISLNYCIVSENYQQSNWLHSFQFDIELVTSHTLNS